MIGNVVAEYPNLEIVATTLRAVHSATVNDWGAVAWSAETGLVQAQHRPRLEILDRVGGGDSFASGLIYGLLTGESLQTAVDYGAAHGALAMTTPGDTSMVAKGDVIKLARGGGARVSASRQNDLKSVTAESRSPRRSGLQRPGRPTARRGRVVGIARR